MHKVKSVGIFKMMKLETTQKKWMTLPLWCLAQCISFKQLGVSTDSLLGTGTVRKTNREIQT